MNDTGWADWYGAVSTALDDLVPRCRTLVVAGLSMGGALALRLAADRGPDVHGLILVNPAVLAEDPRLRLLPLLKWVIPAVPGIGSDIKRPGITELAYPRTPTRAVDSLQHGWAELRRDLPQVNQPLLVLRSAEDHVVPASSTQLILDTVTSEQRREIVLLDSYHVATLDNDADRIIAESLTFLTQVTQPAGGGQ
jgi:carboxylesterase